MPTQLPSGRWRTRVRHPRTGKQLSTRAVIGGPDTYATARGGGRRRGRGAHGCCARAPASASPSREFWDDWTTDPLWLRPAASTNIHNRERTREVRRRARRPAAARDRRRARRRVAQGRPQPSAPSPALRAIFNDAASRAGRPARRPQPVREAAAAVEPRPPRHAAAGAGRDRPLRRARRRADAAVVRRLPRRRRPRGDAPRRARRAALGPRSTSRPGRSSSTSSGTRRRASSRRRSTASSARSR